MDPVMDTGLPALAAIARRHGISTTGAALAHELAVSGRKTGSEDIVRAARMLGLDARLASRRGRSFLELNTSPTILRLKDGRYVIHRVRKDGISFVRDPRASVAHQMSLDDLHKQWTGDAIVVGQPSESAAPPGETLSLSWFIAAIARYRRPLRHILSSSIFIQGFALSMPLLFQVIIDKVLVYKSQYTLGVVVAAMMGIGLFDATLQYLRAYVIAHTSSRVDVELGSQLLRRLLSLPLAYFEKRPVGQTVARVRELENIRSFLTGPGLTSGIDSVFSLLLLAVMFVYSVQLSLIVLAMIVLNVVTVSLVRPLLRQRVREKFYHGARSHQFLVESVSGAATIKAAAIEPLVHQQWEHKLADYVRSAFKVVSLAAVGQNIVLYLNRMTTALVLLFGARAVIAGEMSVGALVAFNMISNQLLGPVMRLSNFWQDVQQAQISVEKISDIFQAEPEPRSGVTPAQTNILGSIALCNVSFRHNADGPLVLKNISLEIRAGEVIGIVGPSGSGKSTLAKLVQRLYAPESGQILVDDVDIAEVDPTWLRRRIGVVLQENLLFNRSVHDNIALVQPSLTRDRVVAMAKLAGADEFIRALPRGYDTQVEERGANLSGGQRQRIAIARALGGNPRILIFDEATSALDYESERKIQQNMAAIARDRTVIIIAHRLAAVRHCDRIIGVVDGEIVEQGTHDELLAKGDGVYARLWRVQSEGMLEAEGLSIS